MKKGFTLIELLAVVIILGVIVLIAVPKVTKMVDTSKKNAAERSADSFLRATEEQVAASKVAVKSIEDEEEETSTKISDGYYTVSQLFDLGVMVKGMAPDDGDVYIKKGLVSGCHLEIGKYTINCTEISKEYSSKLNKKYAVDYDGFKCNQTGIGKVDAVYFNPTTGSTCSLEEYQENLDNYVAKKQQEVDGWGDDDPTYLKTGCLKWYPYHNNSNGTVDMILSHNITKDICWYGDNTDKYVYPSCLQNKDAGPINLISVLKSETDLWTGVPVRTDKYEYNTTNIHYTVDYSDMRAKIISAEEVAEITGNTSFSVEAFDSGSEGGSYGVSETYFLDSCFNRFYFGKFNFTDSSDFDQNIVSDIENYLINNHSIYSWLFDYSMCSSSGCDNSSNTNWGYHTSSAIDLIGVDGYTYYGYQNWKVFGGGALMENAPEKSGIRPVITIDSSLLN